MLFISGFSRFARNINLNIKLAYTYYYIYHVILILTSLYNRGCHGTSRYCCFLCIINYSVLQNDLILCVKCISELLVFVSFALSIEYFILYIHSRNTLTMNSTAHLTRIMHLIYIKDLFDFNVSFSFT